MTILDIENLDSENNKHLELENKILKFENKILKFENDKHLEFEKIKLNEDKIDEMFYFKAYIDNTIEEVLESKKNKKD